MLYILFVFQFIWSKKNRDNSNLQSMLRLIRKNVPPSTATDHYIIPANEIDIYCSLGVGEFGVVQKGVWKNKGQRVS